MKKLIDHLKTKPPNILFHYTSQEGILGILGGREIWATDIQYLNDTREGRIGFEIARHVLLDRTTLAEMKGTQKPLWKAKHDHMKDTLKKVRDKRSANVMTCSFTEHGDLLSQWRGYCQPGPGFSIGFHSKKLLEIQNSDPRILLARCIYDYPTQKQILEEGIDCELKDEFPFVLHERTAFSEISLTLKDRNEFLWFCSPLFKDSSFEEEEEWRLINPRESGEQHQLSFRPGLAMLTPYVRIPLASTAQELGVSNIIVGPCPHPELAKRATVDFILKHGIKRCSVKTTSTSYQSW